MKNKWIHFSIDRESLIGMLSGVGIVILSVIMTIFNNDIANIILRDILMILVLGFFFPLYFTIIENKKSVSVLGIHKKKIVISLAINIIAAIMLLVMFISGNTETSVYKGYKQDKIEMRGDRAEMSDFPLYLNTVAGGLDRRDQTIGGFSFVVKIYAVPVVEIIG